MVTLSDSIAPKVLQPPPTMLQAGASVLTDEPVEKIHIQTIILEKEGSFYKSRAAD